MIDIIYASGYVDAATQSLTAEVNIEPSATIAIDTGTVGGTVDISATPSRNGTFAGTYKSASVNMPVNLAVNTNSDTAFNVQMATASTALATTTGKTIETLPSNCASGCTADSSYFLDRWGYSVDGTTYYPVSSTTNVKTLTTNTGSTADDTSIFFGMKLTSATAPGEYSSTLNFVVVPAGP